jgi:ABC-type nickel/cobalt efflux system permease component RcnA
MAWIIVLLLLLAAVFGVLVAVVKTVAFIVLTILLTIAALVAIVWYSFKAQIRRWERGGTEGRPQARMRSRVDRTQPPRDLPAHDDRY